MMKRILIYTLLVSSYVFAQAPVKTIGLLTDTLWSFNKSDYILRVDIAGLSKANAFTNTNTFNETIYADTVFIRDSNQVIKGALSAAVGSSGIFWRTLSDTTGFVITADDPSTRIYPRLEGYGKNYSPTPSLQGTMMATARIFTIRDSASHNIMAVYRNASSLQRNRVVIGAAVPPGNGQLYLDSLYSVNTLVIPAAVSGRVDLLNVNALWVGDGVHNVPLGQYALANRKVTKGGNVAVGDSALFSDTTSGNTAVGDKALLSVAGATDNAAFGKWAGRWATGADLALFGSLAGTNITTGSELTFIGEQAGYSVTTAKASIAIGSGAWNFGSVDTGDIFIGNGAGWGDSLGSYNFGGGNQSMYQAYGDSNTALGAFSLMFAGASAHCISIGANSGARTFSDDGELLINSYWHGTRNADTIGSIIWGKMTSSPTGIGQRLRLNADTYIGGTLITNGATSNGYTFHANARGMFDSAVVVNGGTADSTLTVTGGFHATRGAVIGAKLSVGGTATGSMIWGDTAAYSLASRWDTTAFTTTGLRVALYEPGMTSTGYAIAAMRPSSDATPVAADLQLTAFCKTDSIVVHRITGTTSGEKIEVNYRKK